MVEIFKTNVSSHLLAQQIINEIKAVYKEADVSFDLEDCDHILRVCVNEEPEEIKQTIVDLFKIAGYLAVALDDDCEVVALDHTSPFFYNKARIDTFLGFF